MAVDHVGGLIETPYEIRIVTQSLTNRYALYADGLALVVEPGFTVTGVDLPSGNSAVIVDDRNFVWIEGSFRSVTNGTCLDIANAPRNVVRNVRMSGEIGGGLSTRGDSCMIRNVVSENGAAAYLSVWGDGCRITGIRGGSLYTYEYRAEGCHSRSGPRHPHGRNTPLQCSCPGRIPA